MPYKFNIFTGKLDYYEEAQSSSVPDNLIVESRTLSALEATNKTITLQNTPPVPNKVVLDIVSGTPQEYATDYSVLGDQLSWLGLGLDVTLSEGDKIRIIYPI